MLTPQQVAPVRSKLILSHSRNRKTLFKVSFLERPRVTPEHMRHMRIP